ncbi:MAG: AMP-binding protein [Candidatus Abyssubacteria bacterium]|nr:AMP-binding protein [Candidatus Abyssubacteria bacterium]
MGIELSMMILGHVIQMKAEASPDKECLIFERNKNPDAHMTYGDLWRDANKIAAMLNREGVGKGDKFAIMMRNHPEFMSAMTAGTLTGAISVPIDPRTKGAKLKYYLDNSEAKVLLITADLIPMVEDIIQELPQVRAVYVNYLPWEEKESKYPTINEVLEGPEEQVGNHIEDPTHPMEIIYTSGTTGDPKGVVCSNNRIAQYALLAQMVWQYAEDEVLYTGLSLTHGNAQAVTIVPGLVLERLTVLSERFTKRRLWDICRKFGCTTFSLLGGMTTGIYSEPEKPDDADNPVRFVISAGMPRAIWEPFEERFDVKILEWYAAVEGGFAYKPIGEGPTGSFGKPVPEMLEMRIVDENDKECPTNVMGELVSRPAGGEKAELEYYKNPEASEKKVRGGWLRSGDMGHTDEDGWFFFDYRKGGGIRHNGDFVHPDFVEKVVAEHPDVTEVAVYGIPAASGAPGEKDVVAAIVPVDRSTLNLVSIYDKCRKELESNFVPSYLQVLDELPKTISEKPQERFLIELFEKDKGSVYTEERVRQN